MSDGREVERLIDLLARLPGLGPRSARRAALHLVKKRDAKGLYRQAESADTPNIVGIDIPRHDPQSPDLYINADEAPAPEELARQIIDAVPWLPDCAELGR